MVQLISRSSVRWASVLTGVFFMLATSLGCFNTYRVSPEEFKKLQSTEKIPRTITSKAGKSLAVERTTNIWVRSTGGRRYRITPFNFKMTPTQLVASDRDYLLSIGEIKSYEVDFLSTPLTVALISVGVAVAGGLIAFAVISAKPE